MHIVMESLFHGLGGSSGLQMTSRVKDDLRIELSDLNYPGIHDMLPLVASEAMVASK